MCYVGEVNKEDVRLVLKKIEKDKPEKTETRIVYETASVCKHLIIKLFTKKEFIWSKLNFAIFISSKIYTF